MQAPPASGTPPDRGVGGANPILGFVQRPVHRFAAELLAMCAVMCIGRNPLDVAFFDGLGFSNLVQQAPAVAVLVIVFNLSLSMAVCT